MNVLILPVVYSARRFTGVSLVNYFFDLIRIVNSYRSDVNWFFGVPSTDEFIKWSEEDFLGLERVVPLPILAKDGWDRSKVKDGFCGIDHPWFGPKVFQFFSDHRKVLLIDVVISSYPWAQSALKFQPEYSSKYHYMLPKVGLPSIVNLMSESRGDPSLFKLQSETGEKVMAEGMLHSDVTVVLTEQDAREARRLARKYLSPSVARKVEVRNILPIADMDKIPTIERPRDRCRFFYGGTFEAKRHLSYIADVVGKLYSSGNLCELYVCTQWDYAPEWVQQKKSFMKVHFDVDREEFLSRLGDGDFIPCYIDYEGTGLAVVEAVASGMVPIVMRKPWNEGRFPKDYPFLCTTEREFESAMSFCARNPARAKEIGREAVEYTRKIFDRRVLASQWSDVLDRCMERRNVDTRRRASGHFMYKLVEEVVADLPVEFTKEDLLVAIEAKSRNMDRRRLDATWPQVRALALAVGSREIKTDKFRKTEE